MNQKPKNPAPSKSFFRTKEEQLKIIEARKQEEAALIEHLEGILDKIDQREAKARARDLAHTTRPCPSAFGLQGTTPVVFRAGLSVLVG